MLTAIIAGCSGFLAPTLVTAATSLLGVSAVEAQIAVKVFQLTKGRPPVTRPPDTPKQRMLDRMAKYPWM